MTYLKSSVADEFPEYYADLINTLDREKFWRQVDKTSGCWFWRGALDAGGYGMFCFDGFSISAHRLSYIFVHGLISKKIHIHHRCRCAPCINPDHLEALTPFEHRQKHTDHLMIRQADMLAKHRPKLPRPILTINHRVQAVKAKLRLQGIRLCRATLMDRPYLGEYYLIDLKKREVLRVKVNLLDLSRELGLEGIDPSPRNDSGVNCVVSTEVLG